MSLYTLADNVIILGTKGYIGSHLLNYLSVININPWITNIRLENITIPIEHKTIINCTGRNPKDNVKVNDYIRDNILALDNLIEYSKTSRIIQLSSMSVYSNTTYGLSKLLGERLLLEKTDNCIILRLPKITDEITNYGFKEIENRIYIPENAVVDKLPVTYNLMGIINLCRNILDIIIG